MEQDQTPDWYGNGQVNEAQLAVALDGLRPRLRRMVHLRISPPLRARIDASDVLQDTFVEALRRASEHATKPDVPFFVWVRFLALQKLAQAHRRHLGTQKRDALREMAQQGAGSQASSIVMAELLSASLASPSQQVMEHERKAAVLAVLESLEEPDREVLALRHFEGLSNRECAHVLSLSDGGASRRYARAALRFAAALKESGFDQIEQVFGGV